MYKTKNETKNNLVGVDDHINPIKYNNMIMSNDVGVALLGDPKINKIKIKKFKQNSAITLIALVITIIVLLILAGLTLTFVLGENGLFGKAKNAKERTEIAQAIEDVKLKILEVQTDAASEGRTATLEDLYNKLKELQDEEYKITISAQTSTLTNDSNQFEGTITKLYIRNMKYSYVVIVGSNLEVENDVQTASNSAGSNSNGTGISSGNGSENANNYNPNVFDVWTTWLKLAGIENPEQYNNQNIIENETIMQTVLNSESALEYMFNSKNFIMPAISNSDLAVNYIISSKTATIKAMQNKAFVDVIANNGKIERFDEIATKVPKQSSSVEDDNIVYSGKLLSNTIPQNAFNESYASGWDDNQMWQDATSSDDGYIGYNFGERVLIYKFDINAATYSSTQNQFSFVLEGLNENGTWEKIGDEYLTDFKSANTFSTNTYYVENDKFYYGYRIKNNYSVSGNGNRYWAIYANSGFGIGELTFYCIKQ